MCAIFQKTGMVVSLGLFLIINTLQAQGTKISDQIVDTEYLKHVEERISSGNKAFEQATLSDSHEVSVMFSFETASDINRVIDIVQAYDLNIIGFHGNPPGGSYVLLKESDPKQEVEGFRSAMLRMSESLISSFESTVSDESLPEELRLNSTQQLNGFKELQASLTNEKSFNIIGVDIIGSGKILRQFAEENINLSRAKEVIFPGRRFSAIPPSG